jgi:hypothetical protein
MGSDAVYMIFNDVSEERVASVVCSVLEAGHFSETSVNFYQTARQCIPEESNLES